MWSLICSETSRSGFARFIIFYIKWDIFLSLDKIGIKTLRFCSSRCFRWRNVARACASFTDSQFENLSWTSIRTETGPVLNRIRVKILFQNWFIGRLPLAVQVECFVWYLNFWRWIFWRVIWSAVTACIHQALYISCSGLL